MASDALLPTVVCVLTFVFCFFFQLLHYKPMIIMPVGLYLLNASLVFLVEPRASMLHVLEVTKTLENPVLFIYSIQAAVRFQKERGREQEYIMATLMPKCNPLFNFD